MEKLINLFIIIFIYIMSYFKRIIENNNKIQIKNEIINNINKKEFFKSINLNDKESELIMNNLEENGYTLETVLSNFLSNETFSWR